MYDLINSGLLEALRFHKAIRKRHGRRKRRRFKQRIFWRDGGLCAYCFEKVPYDKSTLDHIVPLVHGGSDRHKENFTIACEPCNRKKAQLLLEELADLAPDVLKKKFAKNCT